MQGPQGPGNRISPLSPCFPHELSASGAVSSTQGSLHILFHRPTLSVAVQSLGFGLRGLGLNPDLVISCVSLSKSPNFYVPQFPQL